MRRSRAPGSIPTLGAVSFSCACLALAAPSFAFAFNIGPSSVGWVRHHRHHAAAPQRAAGTAAFASPTMVAAEPVAGLMKTVTVDLDDRSYPIYIGTGILERYICCNAVNAWMYVGESAGSLFLAQCGASCHKVTVFPRATFCCSRGSLFTCMFVCRAPETKRKACVDGDERLRDCYFPVDTLVRPAGCSCDSFAAAGQRYFCGPHALLV